MSGGEILYFEIDESHTLNEAEFLWISHTAAFASSMSHVCQVAKRDMNYEVLCIAAGVPAVPVCCCGLLRCP